MNMQPIYIDIWGNITPTRTPDTAVTLNSNTTVVDAHDRIHNAFPDVPQAESIWLAVIQLISQRSTAHVHQSETL